MKSLFLKLILGCLFVFIFRSVNAQADSLILKAKQALAAGQTVSQLLSDPRFDSLKTETAFRELIQQNAKPEPVTIVHAREPGTPIVVKGKLTDSKNQPLSNILIYVYQTDTRGWYGSDRPHFQMNEGDRKHARLFGYFKTNAKGEFEIHTIQPHGYPQSDLPAHIHFEVFNKEGRVLFITELLFDDDERLQGEIRSRSQRDGFFISKPVREASNKLYQYSIIIDPNL